MPPTRKSLEVHHLPKTAQNGEWKAAQQIRPLDQAFVCWIVHHSLNVCSPLTFAEHRYRIGKPRSTSSTRQCSPFFCAPLSKQRHRHPAQLSGKYRNASVPADQSHLSFHQLFGRTNKLTENLKKLQEDRAKKNLRI
jgi:hypothetical protein